MELGLSMNLLGDTSKAPFGGLNQKCVDRAEGRGLGFCMGLSMDEDPHLQLQLQLQLDLLPNTPVPRNSTNPFPWPSSDNGSSEGGSSRGNRVVETEVVSSPNSNSAASSLDLWRNNKRDAEMEEEEDNNGNSSRKKLRLSKEQSAFLEDTFKDHNTLNPKQKLALAKQLDLRPRQVEVWFQNRRARTKLKQTEVDCEYLKRCCETLTEENRRLHKEVQDLRALKTSTPFHMHLPATTLTICPNCERPKT